VCNTPLGIGFSWAGREIEVAYGTVFGLASSVFVPQSVAFLAQGFRKVLEIIFKMGESGIK
jgi:hypothetical protein